MHGKHKTNKSKNDITYSEKWSGVSYAPHCKYCFCNVCGEKLHIEGQDTHYCPVCDDFRPPTSKLCKHR